MDSFEVAKSGDSSFLVKGKRMKRQRPPSPLWSSGGAASSSSSAGDFSPPSSSGKVYESTEEDEDLAHCLILLARGGPRRRRLSPEVTESRRSSKKYAELVAAGDGATGGDGVGRAGFYVYECKTCSRVFPSFQALGGHRASHKKPKTFTSTTEEVMKKSSAAVPESHEYDDNDEGQFRAVCSSLLPIAPNKLPKIHECSICGSEFSSGQALGGHMRRHRAIVGPAGAQVVTVLGLESPVASDHHHVEEKLARDDVLSLDLNLPAPAELEEHRDSKFEFVRRPLGLSSPALIDCHY